jgi:protein SCO1/2
MKVLALTGWLVLVGAGAAWATERFPVTGLVLRVNPADASFVVSCQPVPGHMEAMVMPFQVRNAKELDGVTAGMMVAFTLLEDNKSAVAEDIRILRYESVEQDPLTARRLDLLDQIAGAHSVSTKALSIGQAVPDFALIDQNRRSVSLSQFAGKVVAINFIYTSCPLPNYCLRIANNFGVLQKRFRGQLGRDLILLSVTFDPVHDQPEVLAKYATQWNANPDRWHFLTGPVTEVGGITRLFAVDAFSNEGFMDHSLHTAIIDRQGKLAANIEGNQFTADQLGDLVQAVLSPQSATQ